MVQSFTSAFSSGDSYVQIAFDLALPDEIIKTAWPQAGIEGYVLTAGFTRYNASYFNLTPLASIIFYQIVPYSQLFSLKLEI